MVGGLGLRVNMSVYGLQTLPNEGLKYKSAPICTLGKIF